MTKAAAVTHVLAILLATALAAPAQTAPANDADVAINTAVLRQANKILLRQQLADAADAVQRRDLPAAAKIYDSSVELVGQIGVNNCAEEAAQAVSGFSGVRLKLAEIARQRGQYREVDAQLVRILKVDPKNQQAIALKAANDKTLNELKGQIATDETYKEAAKAREEKVSASTHVQNAKLLLESGRLDEADAELDRALSIDPQSTAALRYKNLVKEDRYKISRGRSNQDNANKILQVSQAWNDPPRGANLPVPNPFNEKNDIHTGKGRQAIMNKLNAIKFETFPPEGSPDTLPLSEVVRILGAESPKRDPEKEGVNILINPNAPTVALAAPSAIDPATGLALPPPPIESVDVSGINVKFSAPLRRVSLNNVLDALTTMAERPLKITFKDYAIEIGLKGAEPIALATRTFSVDPNTFYQGLVGVGGLVLDIQSSSGGGGGGRGGGGGGGQSGGDSSFIIPRVSVTGSSGSSGGGSRGGGGGGGSSQGGGSIFPATVGGGGQGGVGGGGGGGGGQGAAGITAVTTQNNMEVIHNAVRQFFITMGVNLDPLLGKSIFFNDRKGELWVRATTDELDLIEQIIQVLNVAPPQVNIKTRFTEISQNDNKALGFDWYLGNMLMGGGKLGAQGGSAPSYGGAPTAANPYGSFPGQTITDIAGNVISDTTIPTSSTDTLLTGSLRNTFGRDNTSIPALATFTGILTDPQFRVVLKALENRDGIDLLNEGQVTTLSGRQAQIQVSEVKTIVTGIDNQQGNQGGTTSSTGGGTVNQAAAATFVQPTTSPVPLGPVIDVLPTVSADGYTIQMTIIPTLTEFVGYDLATAATFVPTAITGTGQSINSVLPLPIFRVRQLTTSCSVWDGQTIVLGGLISDNVVKIKDKVPFLGDLPLMGKLFTSESSQTTKKNLVIFVTPRIIDPAGNPAHLDEEMPFLQARPSSK